MGKLTDRTVNAARAVNGEVVMGDGAGLYLRVRPNNAPKVWFFRYTINGKTRKMQLGAYPLLTLAAAREKRDALLKLTKQGTDPTVAIAKEAEEREAKERALAARLTVNDLFSRWQTVELVRRKDKGAEITRMFRKDVLPKIGNLYVEDVRKGHITEIVDELLSRGVTRMAKLVFGLIRQMFRYAAERDIIDFEPTATIRKSKIGGKDTERDRVLSEDEIKALHKQISNAKLLDTTQLAVWICLATCCRIGELTNAKWEHIDIENMRWWIPPENSKNARAHNIQLSKFAVDKFEALKVAFQGKHERRQEKNKKNKNPIENPSPFVFPDKSKNKPVSSKTITKQLSDRQRVNLNPHKHRVGGALSGALVLKGGKWTPHDLRRTGATIMVSLGVLPEVAERCLNHIEQNKIKRTYQHHSYEKEMAEAWQLLGERLDLLTTKSSQNIVTIKKVAA